MEIQTPEPQLPLEIMLEPQQQQEEPPQEEQEQELLPPNQEEMEEQQQQEEEPQQQTEEEEQQQQQDQPLEQIQEEQLPQQQEHHPQQQQTEEAQKKRPASKKRVDGDIVYMKGTSVHTLPSLSKQLLVYTEAIIGLHYVWECRSPSKAVPPHYQCKLCNVVYMQNDMIAHVKSWKHSFRYLTKIQNAKVTWTEEQASKDPAIRRKIKEIASEVEKVEGRGKHKVIVKEPCEVPAYRGLASAIPKTKPPQAANQRQNPPPFGSRYPGMRPPAVPLQNYPQEEYVDRSYDEYSYAEDFSEPDAHMRSFPNNQGRGGYGMSGRGDQNPGRMYPEEYRGDEMARPVGESQENLQSFPENKSPNALLGFLDTFRIEDENDAQLVLKVTQKLTDALMEYRLRSIQSGPAQSSSSSSLNSTSFFSSSSSSAPQSRFSSSNRYSSNQPGQTRYSGTQPRYY